MQINRLYNTWFQKNSGSASQATPLPGQDFSLASGWDLQMPLSALKPDPSRIPVKSMLTSVMCRSVDFNKEEKAVFVALTQKDRPGARKIKRANILL